MPVFYQKNINETTRLGIWRIEEDQAFFRQLVPLHRHVTHAHKRLQHLAGRFLLKYLFADFPSDLIQIADTKKPFLPNGAYHFSISHCGDYAAAIVSKNNRVGIDIEIPTNKVARIRHKFISNDDDELLAPQNIEELTQLWSAKEAIFKWDGNGEVDFKQHIQLKQYKRNRSLMECYFLKRNMLVDIHLEYLSPLCLSYIYTSTLL